MVELTPVSQDRHGGRFWRRFSSYEFVRELQQVPIVLGEHEQVAATLPIVFAQTSAGPWPVALTRLGAQTALVAPNGAWRGSYVPSILRVHPFHAKPTGDGQFVLLVDEGSGLVTDDPAGEAFFDAQGGLSATVAEVVDFFRNRSAAETRTREAMSQIAACDLLRPLRMPGGLDAPGAGLMEPDAESLAALTRGELSALHRVSALSLLHASRVARHHMAFLAHAEAVAAQQATSSPSRDQADAAGVGAADAGLSGFFDALADAQDAETTLPDLGDDSGPARDDDGGTERSH